MEASQPGRILLIDDDPALGGYLTTKAAELIRAGREARAKGREIVLAIGAHPDDVEIGAAARCWPTGRRATPWPS